ncbi:expressed unknown protein [Seminavis robusta]|uniref:FAM192A/Fyv6 N-terminal domain-containing protein n=1 Tax=Seminavis robusta TaxID=568900 RepID=A0A9N8HC21_9STRA|nr:expressed unknown protein [Seminavis robusta]|eukprot:Sro361_g126470.1 n/a (217) ;mRNA; r:21934-22584
MSLSFVSKAVLTAKEGGGYEETAVEGKESEGSSGVTTSSQPLFEQLRANKEQEEMERDEFQKSIMRGTLALDEEDCAHLDALQKQRQEREQMIQNETQSELESFRAAQAVNRMEQGMKDEDEELEVKRKREDEEIQRKKKSSEADKKATSVKPKFPKIVVKKKRKVDPNKSNKEETDTSSVEAKKPKKEESKPAAKAETPALSGLLAGYGSDSDSD